MAWPRGRARSRISGRALPEGILLSRLFLLGFVALSLAGCLDTRKEKIYVRRVPPTKEELDGKNVDALAATFVADLAPQPVPAAAVATFRLDDAIACGRATIKAMKEASRTLALDDDTTKTIREVGGFVLPRLVNEAK